jgi:hypothetical protein
MTPILPYPNLTSNPIINIPNKSQKSRPIYVRIWAGFVKVGFEVGFNLTKNLKNEHPHLSSTSILHDLIVKLFFLCCRTTVTPPPPPPHPTSRQPLLFSASATAHLLIVVFLSLWSALLLLLHHQL